MQMKQMQGQGIIFLTNVPQVQLFSELYADPEYVRIVMNT